MDKKDVEDVIKDGFCSIKEAGRFLSLCRGTILKMIEDGRLPAVRFGRARRIPWRGLKTLACGLLKKKRTKKKEKA